LVEWCNRRHNSLTLVFDQSYSRGNKNGILQKLEYFASRKIYGFAYDSHATFLILSNDSELAAKASRTLLKVSGYLNRGSLVFERCSSGKIDAKEETNQEAFGSGQLARS
jgi:hypothetical protein